MFRNTIIVNQIWNQKGKNHFSIAEPEYIVQSILGGTSWEMMSQLGPPEVEPESLEIYPWI